MFFPLLSLPVAKRFLLQWIALIAVMLVLGGYLALIQYRERASVETLEKERLASQAMVVEKNLIPQIDATRQALARIAEQWSMTDLRNGQGTAQANRHLQAVGEALVGMHTLLMVDADGRVLASDDVALVGADLSSREYFQQARQQAGSDMLYLTPPFKTTANTTVMTFYRAITGADGAFGGLVGANIDPAYFRTLLDSVCYTPDAWSYLAHGDGNLFMMVPDRGAAPVQNLVVPGSLFVRHRESGRGTSTFEDRVVVTGEDRLIAFRTIQPAALKMNKPLVVTVSRDVQAVFAPWRRGVDSAIGMFGMLVVVAVVGLFVYQQRQYALDRLVDLHEDERVRAERALHDSNAQLQAIFDASPDPLLISSSDGRIVMANQQIERLLGFTVAELVGQSVDRLVPVRHRSTHVDQRAEFAQSGRQRRMGHGLSVRACRKDGTECDVEVSLSRIETDQGIFFASALRDITERRRADAELRIAAVAFESHEGMVITDANDIILRVNRAFTQITGYSADEVVGHKMNILKSDRHDKGFYASIWNKVLTEGSWRGEIWNRHKNGEVRPHGLTISAVREGDAVTHYIGTYVDVSERKLADEQLRIAAAAFESQEGMMITDAQGVILRINKAFSESTGYPPEEIVGKRPNILRSGRHPREFYRQMWESILTNGGWQGEIWDRRRNGEIYPKWLTISTVRSEDGAVTNYIGMHHDISERKLAEEKIKELAFFDQLTGMPNRTLLMDRLKQAMTASGRSGAYGALLFIDLDNFKTLNDTLGHDMGDLLLKQVAQRLTQCVREGDTVARLGGDEFVVILGGLSSSERDAASGTEIVAEKILAMLNQPYQLGVVAHHSTASIGATLFRDQRATIDDLMKQADLAMYRAKDAGRNALRFFDPDMETAVLRRAALEKDMREALQARQFLLHYQAQVTEEGRVTGAEVLLRWRHPERGMVSPGEFIPLAEETGVILPLGRWVLETACAQLAAWADHPVLGRLTIAVNVSAHQFRQPDFVEQVMSVLRGSGANPQRLKLELTESLLVANVEDIIEKMFALKGKGLGFSLDDFGTGYSSLSYLKRLPLDLLKIDQSFVRDVLIDPNDAAIARTIVALAQSLGLGVIAEGVETESQRDFLAHSGCHAYQGYLFSRPLPLADFESLVLRAQS